MSAAAVVAAILVVIIILIAVGFVVEAIKKKSGGGSSGGGSSGGSSGGGSSGGKWGAIKKAWPTKKGAVLNTVIGTNAGSASTGWVTDNAPDVGKAMKQADANVVCDKACTGWSSVAQVSDYCDCSSQTAVGF
jgi:hypothetical protein